MPQTEPASPPTAAAGADDFFNVNCGRCGRALRMTVDEVRGLRTVDCEDCAEARTGSQAVGADAVASTAHVLWKGFARLRRAAKD